MDATAPTRTALRERKDDLYQTPAVATRALIKNELLQDMVWEPACGRGAISYCLKQAGYGVLSTDLVDYGYGEGRQDFLMQWQVPPNVKTIVTNPPFKLANEFVRHALSLGVPKVVMLLRFMFLEGNGRSDIIDGGQLARVHLFRNRLPMMHRDGWEGEQTTSATAFAWFVWEYDNKLPTIINRITWE